MLTRRGSIDLAPGVKATFTWAFDDDAPLPDWAVPTGLLLEHPSRTDPMRRCLCSVRWVGDAAPVSLVSLVPLTVDPAFTCTRCDLVGEIADGKWRYL